MAEFGLNTNPPNNNINTDETNNPSVPGNTDIQDYNDQIKAKVVDFQAQIATLNNDADLQLGLLMSIGQGEQPEVTKQINLIFQVRE